MKKIATVTGEIAPDDLGRTLMHEHLVIGYPGSEGHSTHPGPSSEEQFEICVDRIARLQDLGFCTLLDPCPADLGRDVELAARVEQATGFQIICATGLYKEEEGGAAYWKFRAAFEPQIEAMTELFVRELTEGIGETGVRAGIIKVATGPGQITEYERWVLEAAGRASLATGAPITTHTDKGTMGDAQQKILTDLGVPAHRIIVGHSCGTDDHAYHMRIARGGSYLGFDRFGIEVIQPDAKRVEALVRMIRSGAGDRLVVSHDSVWCWRGEPLPKALLDAAVDLFDPTHFSRNIVPRLYEAGVTESEVERLLVDNPRRFFEGGALVPLA